MVVGGWLAYAIFEKLSRASANDSIVSSALPFSMPSRTQWRRCPSRTMNDRRWSAPFAALSCVRISSQGTSSASIFWTPVSCPIIFFSRSWRAVTSSMHFLMACFPFLKSAHIIPYPRMVCKAQRQKLCRCIFGDVPSSHRFRRIYFEKSFGRNLSSANGRDRVFVLPVRQP